MMLGEGGFGITYIGWDLNLDLKVAIKEYYPSGFVTRETTSATTVQPFSGSQGDFFLKGRDKFINEAKSLAKFFALPGIVAVKDYFLENGTAYIVMEYIEGKTMKGYLAEMGGKLPAAQVFDMLKPVMPSLSKVHQSGMIHRDISPDNIMLSDEGGMKLLDFGAAREFDGSGSKSLSVMLKPGFAPEEQYRSKGVQGPWTDVYALCATMYRCITGVTPTESNERVIEDDLKPPSALGAYIGAAQEAALMRGLAVFAKDRCQSIQELYDALYGAPAAAAQPEEPLPADLPATVFVEPPPQTVKHSPAPKPAVEPKAKQSWFAKNKILAASVAGVCAVALIVWAVWPSGSDEIPEPYESPSPEPVMEVVGEVTPSPTPEPDEPTPTPTPEPTPDTPTPTPTPEPTPDEPAPTPSTPTPSTPTPSTPTPSTPTPSTPTPSTPTPSTPTPSTPTPSTPTPASNTITLGRKTININDTSVSLGDRGISDISELSRLTSVTELRLGSNRISDISALSGLNTLTHLRLNNNRISDVSALRGLTNLRLLHLENNSISDISALSGLTNLTTELVLRDNRISDISALRGLTNLRLLALNNNSISDISALRGLTSLTWLNLENNSVSDISALSGLTNLGTLILRNNSISNVSALSGLTNLYTLRISGSPISDISPLKGLTGLRIFNHGGSLTQAQINELRAALPNCDINI
jgi:serine/threonine protein kinase